MSERKMLKAVVLDSDATTGDISVSIVDYGGGRWPVTKVGRSASDGTWLVPVPGAVIWVVPSDDNATHVVWVGSGTVRSSTALPTMTSIDIGDYFTVYDTSTSQLKRATVGTIMGPYGFQRRNMVDNAAAQIAQRRYALGGITTSPGNIHSADRWKLESVFAASPPTMESAITDVLTPEGLDRAHRITITGNPKAALAADDHIVVYQSIEGTTLRAVQATSSLTGFKPTVCSFWVYPTLAGNYVTEFRLNDASGLGIKYISQITTLVANQWQKVTFSLPAATTSSSIGGGLDAGAHIFFWLAAGSNWNSATLNTGWTTSPASNSRATGQVNMAGTLSAVWHITNVQWEVGTEPTPFERLSWDDDMRRCMRYYQMMTSINGVGTPQDGEGSGVFRIFGTGMMGSTATAVIKLEHIVPMRRAVFSIDVSAANTFQIWEGTRTGVVTSLNGQIDGGSPYATRLDAGSAGGFIEGNGCILRANSVNTAYLGLSADI